MRAGSDPAPCGAPLSESLSRDLACAKISGPMKNMDDKTVAGFGFEWSKYDQSCLPEAELHAHFDSYFNIFPWQDLPPAAEGFDLGCGTGRWAQKVAPRVAKLNCIDASPAA